MHAIAAPGSCARALRVSASAITSLASIVVLAAGPASAAARASSQKAAAPTVSLGPALTVTTTSDPFAPVLGPTLDLANAIVVARAGGIPKAERTAAAVLVEEVEKRTGIRLQTVTTRPRTGTIIDLSSVSNPRDAQQLGLKAEGYRIAVDTATAGLTSLRVIGADGRGVLFGVGYLLRKMTWRNGAVSVSRAIDIATSPAYAIRGHQLGYRARANSYDAWTPQQYEQYIRELAFFGANAMENIPFEDVMASPHMPIPRDQMNVRLGEICDKYDVQYWVWTPAVFDLSDTTKRAAEIAKHEAFYRATPRLDAVFFPGGDPGNNHPRAVMPFLQELATILHRYHPNAGMWISLQGFNREAVEYFYQYLQDDNPTWLAGVVAGPGSPPIPMTRELLPRQYRLRSYPDVTHNVRCQHPVAWWDPALNFTLGRESPNPRPVEYAAIHNQDAPYTDGFLTYSDGVHDDVNKTIYSARGWNPEADVRDVLVDYANVYFASDVAQPAADGILALEQNWRGGLKLNGGVEATYALWNDLDAKATYARPTWRWQLALLRADYDAYTRSRLLYESELERQANDVLAYAPTRGPEAVMADALAIVRRADTQRARPELRQRIDDLAVSLFHSIGLQTSVPRFQASETERGAIMDFVDYPLNNRWWLEDEFARVDSLPTREGKLARLELIRTWENPGPGSYYDDIGNVGKSPHVARQPDIAGGPSGQRFSPSPGFVWQNGGYSRARLSWQSSMSPRALVYENLDPQANYVVRVCGSGNVYLSVDSMEVQPTEYILRLGAGQLKEYPVPKDALADGRITVTFGRPMARSAVMAAAAGAMRGRGGRMTDVWLLKR